MNEVIAPIKALAHGDKEMLELISNTASALQEELLSDRRESLEAKVIEGLFKLRAKGSDAELSAKAVAATIASDMDSTADSPTDKKVGWAFKRLNLKTGQGSKSRRSVVVWDQARMEGLARRYGLSFLVSEKESPSIPETEPSKPSEASEQLQNPPKDLAGAPEKPSPKPSYLDGDNPSYGAKDSKVLKDPCGHEKPCSCEIWETGCDPLKVCTHCQMQSICLQCGGCREWAVPLLGETPAETASDILEVD